MEPFASAPKFLDGANKQGGQLWINAPVRKTVKLFCPSSLVFAGLALTVPFRPGFLEMIRSTSTSENGDQVG